MCSVFPCALQAFESLVRWAKTRSSLAPPPPPPGEVGQKTDGADDGAAELSAAVLAGQGALLSARRAEDLLAAVEGLPC